MAIRGWQPSRHGGDTVFTNDDYPGVRIQPGEHVDGRGRPTRHGLHVARLVDGVWHPVDGVSWFWIADVQAWLQAEMAAPDGALCSAPR
jgi:hypothetical protein